MSGVFGYCGEHTDRPIRDLIERMGQQIRHLPHQQLDHIAVHATVGLGRLHIGKLNRQPQPVRSRDERVWLCLTGTFYVQHEQRRTLENAGLLEPDSDDAVFALALFLHAGAAGIAGLNGAFTCSIWDERDGTLWLINDRYGLYPHYYAHIGGAFAFAPEIKGVIAAPDVPRRINETAIAEYLRFQQLLGEKTWFEDVQLLPPGTLLSYRPAQNQLRLQRYWDWDQIGIVPKISFAEAVTEASRRFQEAIDTMIRGPLRPGIFLSGGLDGRIILAFTNGRTTVPTFTFGAPGSRDVIYAAMIAQRAGVPNRWFPFNDGSWVLQHHDLHLALTEGMHSWIHAHGISMLGEVSREIDVNLSGWDGGTTMGGFAVLENHAADRYYRYPPDETSLTNRLFEAFCQQITWPGMHEGEELALLSGANRERLRGRAFESLRAELARTQHYRPEHRVDYFILLQLIRRSLQNQIITQRSTLEVHCPYFDYRFVEFMYSLPDQIRTQPAFRRAILTKRCPQLALIPYEKDDRLPHSNRFLREGDGLVRRTAAWINRRVGALFPAHPRLYADYEQYLRKELKGWAESVLFDQRTLDRGLFNPTAVRSLWTQHLAGDHLWTIGKVAPLMSIELVLRHLDDTSGASDHPTIQTHPQRSHTMQSIGSDS
jgi:asparagine synthase (glutamine-hydrolysing)